MPEAHIPSDQTAIRDAHDRLAENAAAHLRRCVENHLRRPTRWTHEALCGASIAVWDQGARELEERAGRAEGSFGGEDGAR